MPAGRPRKGCTIRLLPGRRTWIVLFSDPRPGGKVTSKSLKTTDSKVAHYYKNHLDRITSDLTLWIHPHDDCPQRVREIWLGDRLEIEVEVDGRKIQVSPLPGQTRKKRVIKSPTGKTSMPIPGTKDFLRFDLEESKVKGDFSNKARIEAFAGAYRELVIELQGTRTELEAERAKIESLRADNEQLNETIKDQKDDLSKYRKRARRAAKVGTLSEELGIYLKVFTAGKKSPAHKRDVARVLQNLVADFGLERKTDDVTEQDVTDYVHTLKSRQEGKIEVSEGYRRQVRGYVVAFLEKATHGVFSRTEVDTIGSHKVRREQKEVIWLENGDGEKLVSKMYYLHGDYWGDIARFQLSTGWRSEEMPFLQAALCTDKVITFETVHDPVTGKTNGKSGKRSVQVPKVARQAVRRRLSTNGTFLFPMEAKRKRNRKCCKLLVDAWNEKYFNTKYRVRLRAAAEKAKIKKPIDCRILRRTFGSLLIRASRSVYEVSKLMGNSPAIVEKHYARLLAEEISTEL